MSIHAKVRQSDRQGIPCPAPRRYKPFSTAAFTAAWVDQSLRIADIAAQFGISTVQCGRRARGLGLPRRRLGPPFKRTSEAFIRAAWVAGVRASEIAGRAGIDGMTLYARVRAMGLPLRGRGTRAKMTLMEFDQAQLRDAMAASARQTQAALVLSEMVDGWHPLRRVA